ncbi:MAG: DUF5686 and carboxypeptidase regulatory-like domain-containing protein [Saprospiraceae bacterium]|nr:DUF5686 and carboxypeptidase regulatory-like domain-containing protein [Saprospiraceae bacterium]MDZ4704003.1 DUF5686 and carboxypeptidase regulatory-like domain-containing protein [Saprospiraceae bacterium]
MLHSRLLFLCLLLAYTSVAFAGGVRGIIKNQRGEQLEFATIFVQETGTGATANIDGRYEIRLEPGDYTLIFQYLGYKAHIEKVSVGALFKELNVELVEQVLQLKTVEILEGREDPAYTVMRKAIAKADYHRQQVDSYSAKVYIKGSGRLKDSPFFLRKTIAKEGIDSTVAFTSESVSIIEYKRPNTFKEKVISIYKQGDDNSTSPNGFIFASFYQSEVAEAISPLSIKAFGYYRFKLEGYFTERGVGVNRIKVTPRSRGDNVFEGYIYIIEDEWSIHSLSLKSYKLGIAFQVDQVYAPVQEKAWMPVSHRINVDGSVLGFDFEYKYLSTISDYKVKLNPDLPNDFVVVDEKIDKELAAEISKSKQKGKAQLSDLENQLSQGKELTRKDLRKLMKEYEKDEVKAQKEKNEEPIVESNTSFEIDSMATKRDTAYWNEIRPVPLTPYEVRGYVRVDSIATVEAEKAQQDSISTVGKDGKKKKGGFDFFGALFTGDSYKLSKHSQFSFSAPIQRLFFNPVEGFNLSVDLKYRFQKEKRQFGITVTPRYAFAREKLTGKGRVFYSFGEGSKRSDISIEGGRYVSQYNEDKPITEFINTFTCLFQERNYLSIYEKDYLRAGYAKRFSQKLSLRLTAEWAERFTLNNNTTQTWFNRDDRTYTANVPENLEVDSPLPATERAAWASVQVETRPWLKYRMRNKVKEVIENSSPTLTFEYRKGFSGLAESVTDYDLIDFGFKHRFKAGARGTWDVKANVGMFLNSDYVGFADFKHFAGNLLSIATSDPVGSFRLLDYYRHSTADQYAALHVHYQFRKFLLTQIPEVWMMGIKENVFVNYLATPTSKNYVEAGYSIDNIFRLFRVEGAVAFQNGKYYDWGVLIGVSSSLGNLTIE